MNWALVGRESREAFISSGDKCRYLLFQLMFKNAKSIMAQRATLR